MEIRASNFSAWDNIAHIRVQKLREGVGATRAEIAALLHISASNYAKIEKGKVKISNRILAQISIIYGVSTDYLLGLTDNPRPNRDLFK